MFLCCFHHSLSPLTGEPRNSLLSLASATCLISIPFYSIAEVFGMWCTVFITLSACIKVIMVYDCYNAWTIVGSGFGDWSNIESSFKT
jgi:hypothetical protein